MVLDVIVVKHVQEESMDTKMKHWSAEQWSLFTIILVVILIVWVAALVNAYYCKATSATASADVLFAWASPIAYWILKAFGLLCKKVK
jgi:uncharacterized membrane protein